MKRRIATSYPPGYNPNVLDNKTISRHQLLTQVKNMKTYNSIAEAWEEYIKAFLPNGYTKEQYKQLKETFYAGGFFIICRIAEIQAEQSKFSEKETEEKIESLMNELLDYYYMLEKRAAEAKKINPEHN